MIKKAKVYLEGIQVPFSRVTITERLGMPPTCSIVFVSNDKFLNLLAKTVCHVFYFYNNEYRLVYTGELSGIGFQKSEGSRHVSGTFIGFTSNWNDAKMAVSGFGGENRREVEEFYLIQGSPEIPDDDTRDPEVEHTKRVSNGESVERLIPNISAKGWFFAKTGTINNFFDLVDAKLKEIAENGYDDTNKWITEDYGQYKDNVDYIEGLFKSINDFAIVANPYYNILDKRTKLRERLYVIPNTVADDMFVRLMTFKNSPFTGHFRQLRGVNNYSAVLQSLLDYFLYTTSEIATPIYKSPYVKNIIVKPDLDYSVPIKCNVIYPDDLSTLSFSRNFIAEPSRMSGYLSPKLLEGSADPSKALWMYMTPKIWVEENVPGPWVPGVEEPTQVCPGLGLSYRELLSGIRPATMGVPSSVELAFNGAKFPVRDDGDTRDREVERTKYLASHGAYERFAGSQWNADDAEEYIIKILEHKFQNAKLASRSASMTTAYNPSRLIGFPALVIGEKKQASLVGVIDSMTAIIDANGSAIHNISINKVRIVNEHDEDDRSTESRVLRDILAHFEYFYDSNYIPIKIGVNLYNDLMGYDNPDDDASIYDYAKTIMPEVEVGPPYLGFSEIIYYAIRQLKSNIESSNNEERKMFADEQTRRRIPTEAETWTAMGISQDLPISDEAHSHSIADLAGNEFDNEKLKEALILYSDGLEQGRRIFVKERQNAVNDILLTNNVEFT